MYLRGKTVIVCLRSLHVRVHVSGTGDLPISVRPVVMSAGGQRRQCGETKLILVALGYGNRSGVY